MLILGRKPNESVIIGENIVVTILAVEGDRVKVGIEAPAEVRILRQELYDSVKEENLRAATMASQLSSALLPSLNQLLDKKE